MEYSYKITGLKTSTVNEVKNVVTQTYWTLTGTDENKNTGTFNGATPFNDSPVTGSTFVSFDNLTEDIVIGWIKNVVEKNDAYFNHIKEQINNQILDKINADVKMPWSKDSNDAISTASTNNTIITGSTK